MNEGNQTGQNKGGSDAPEILVPEVLPKDYVIPPRREREEKTRNWWPYIILLLLIAALFGGCHWLKSVPPIADAGKNEGPSTNAPTGDSTAQHTNAPAAPVADRPATVPGVHVENIEGDMYVVQGGATITVNKGSNMSAAKDAASQPVQPLVFAEDASTMPIDIPSQQYQPDTWYQVVIPSGKAVVFTKDPSLFKMNFRWPPQGSQPFIEIDLDGMSVGRGETPLQTNFHTGRFGAVASSGKTVYLKFKYYPIR